MIMNNGTQTTSSIAWAEQPIQFMITEDEKLELHNDVVTSLQNKWRITSGVWPSARPRLYVDIFLPITFQSFHIAFISNVC